MADLHCKILDDPPTLPPTSVQFSSFLCSFWQNSRLNKSPLGADTLPSGEYWIRRWEQLLRTICMVIAWLPILLLTKALYIFSLLTRLNRLPLKRFWLSLTTPNHLTVCGNSPTNASTSGRPFVTTSAQHAVESASPWLGDVNLPK